MFIVIEGTDASGKTSLIAAVEKELATRFPDVQISMFHKGKPEELTRRWVLNDYVLSIEKRNVQRSLLLSDRWHWGEVTYAPKYRPKTNNDGYGLLTKAGWRWTELFLQSRGAMQVWLYQPLDVIQRRLSARGDEFVQVEDLKEILAQYEIASKESMIQMKMSPDADSIDEIPEYARRIVDTALLAESSVSHLEFFPQYIGNPKPSVLLVGDRHNATKRHGHETDLAFMPVDGNSGEYLLSALPDEFWKTVGIVNINDHKDSFASLWAMLGHPLIIALGRQAEKTLALLPIDEEYYRVLPHPQYVRRFFNTRKEEYGEAISRITETKSKDDEWILR
jgi:gluconate kinase